MPINIGREMALPMEQIIGGPLQAVIRAQAMAAATTADFIKSVGLTGDDDDLQARIVAFSFKRSVPKADGSGTEEETVELRVPLLTIIPVPFIRVEEATIDFECKVASSTLSTSESNFGLDASASGGFFGCKFSVKASYSHKSTYQDKVTREATLNVHVKAVQDQMPAGLAKVLEILNTAVNDAKKSA